MCAMKSSAAKIQRRAISGVFLLNKPLGISSNAALQKVRWLYRAQKAGHTGALDPLASGLLPICLGEATKFSHYLLDSVKRYQTTIQLGHSTTTGDVEGDVLLQQAVPALGQERIEQVLAQFQGDIMQVPPMYSALKKKVVRYMNWHDKALKLNVKRVQSQFMSLSCCLLLNRASLWM